MISMRLGLSAGAIQAPCVSKYAAHGWLEQVARGVYRRPAAALPDPNKPDPNKNKKEGRLRWQHVVVSLQTIRPAAGGRWPDGA